MLRALEVGIRVCRECHALQRPSGHDRIPCARCGAVVHARRPNSQARAWALLITAAVMYIPANALPIMTVNFMGNGMPATILEGVIELIHAGMLPIAAVVFIASILVPTLKLLGLALLLISVECRQPLSARDRIATYRFIEWIGRWSMLDIFVIATLVALVRFENLARIEPNSGATAFAGVVVITMLAAVSFDPRLIWDNPHREENDE